MTNQHDVGIDRFPLREVEDGIWNGGVVRFKRFENQQESYCSGIQIRLI